MNIKPLTYTIMSTLLAACSAGTGTIDKDHIIGQLSLEDKAHFVIGTGQQGVSENSGAGQAVVGATKNLVPGAAGTTYPLDSLGIPAIVLADGPAGLRIDPTREGDSATYYCTHFPIGSLLASTWNQELVEQVGKAIGEEVRDYGADVLLAPALNIQRHPLCGRNFEYYSEDPLLAGKTAAAYVRGIQTCGVGTSIKHFTANNQETNRMNNDARVSQRALREIYLRPFEIAVKEGRPWTVMSSYNYLNGTYTSENRELLTTLLRDEWGYEGLVMTDWLGGKDGAAQIGAGNDMLQPGKQEQYDSIVGAVRRGTLDEHLLDVSVGRVLDLIAKTPRWKGIKPSNRPDLKAHAAVTRQSATEGMVLLKNQDNTLPLPTADSQQANGEVRLALYGCCSYDFIAGGTGSGNVNHAYVVSLIDGLHNAGYQTDPSLQAAYKTHIAQEKARINAELEAQAGSDEKMKLLLQYLPVPLPREKTFTPQELEEQSQKANAAIITLGRCPGEFADRTQADFSLSAEERALVEGVCRAYHQAGKRVIVLLNTGGVLETQSWSPLPDAILCAWQGGQEGGNSVADILSGKVSPSGRLPQTWPIALADMPSASCFPLDESVSFDIHTQGQKGLRRNVDFTDYEEDIYVGYRYFDSFGRDVAYPFGFGLSYTTFEYGPMSVDRKADGTIIARLSVKNTGQVAAKEVVQLYVKAPDSQAQNKPEQELRAFAKTRMLKPGESQEISLAFKESDLASFDTGRSAWKVTPGRYVLVAGASSRDPRQQAVLTVDKAQETPVHNILKPQHPLRLLKR